MGVVVSLFLLTPDTIEILFTNDIKGQFHTTYALFINPVFPPPLGGEKSFLSFLKNERRKNKELLLIDAGNMSGGYITGDSFYIEKVADFYKKAGYNLMVPGRREFIGGREGIEKMLKLGINLISANITTQEDTLKPLLPPYKIISIKGVKIGLFGLTSHYMPFYLQERVKDDFYFLNDIETAKKMVKELRKKVDIVIGVSNTGIEREKRIASEVRGIDFILGGGSGYGLREPYEDPLTHTVLLRNYEYFSGFGKLEIIFDKRTKTITGYKYQNITLFEEEF